MIKERRSPSHQLESHHLRGQLALVLAITVGLGVALGRLLLFLGFDSLVLRNAIVFPVDYCIFFACVYLWRKKADYLPATTRSGHPSDKTKSEQKEVKPSPADKVDRKKGSWFNHLYFDFGEATIILVALVVIIWVIVWIFGEAPAIMSEAFFDVGLSASLAGALRKRPGTPWYVGLFRKTIIAFLAFYFSSALLLLFAQKTCPNRTTLAKIVHECWMQ